MAVPEQESEALLEALEDLVRGHGHEPFVARPIVLPTPEFFPDAWTPDLNGARVLATRLVAYAGLGDRTVELVPGGAERSWDTHATPGGIARSVSVQGGVILLELDAKRIVLAVDEARASDADTTVGLLARALAQAWRRTKKLELADPADEEPLIDVTAAYLGLGVVVGNNAYRFRRRGEIMGHGVMTETRVVQEGALSPQAVGFLVGTQLAVREDKAETKAVLSAFEPRQREGAERALKEGRGREEQLRDRLGVPPPLVWRTGRAKAGVAASAIASPPPTTAPSAPAAITAAPNSTPGPRAKSTRRNEGEPIVRVRSSYRHWLLSGAVGVGGTIYSANASLLALGISIGIGALLWLWAKPFSCGGTSCSRSYRKSAAVCPSCGGVIVATVGKLREKYAAIEEWRRTHPEEARRFGADEEDEAALAEVALAAGSPEEA